MYAPACWAANVKVAGEITGGAWVAVKITHAKERCMATKLPRGLDGRTRDQNPPKAGEIRQKRGDTKLSTLRREYGDGFAAGIRSDATLETVRERTGKSLHQLVRDMPKKK
jgi:hypothetical protein